MAIRNNMELLVREEVQQLRKRAKKGKGVCLCALCETDIVALALNHLPARYCQQSSSVTTASQGIDEAVRNAVSHAAEKVGRRPKHSPGTPQADVEEIRMENYAEKIGQALVQSAPAPESPGCACERCQTDTLSLALNHYPPKYGVSYGGRESYQSNYEDFIRHEIAEAIAQALPVIRKHPHH